MASKDLDIVVTVRSLNGNIMFGPESLPRSTSCATLLEALVDPSQPQSAKLILGILELSRHEPIGNLVDDGIEELEVQGIVSTLKLTKPERREHQAILRGLVTTGRRNRRALRADALLQLPEAARADRAIVQEALDLDGCALEHVHSSLKADRAIVSEAVGSRSMALLYGHPQFLFDRSLVMKALKVGGVRDRAALFQHLGHDFRADIEIAHAACLKDLENLKYIDVALRTDLPFWYGLLPFLPAHSDWPGDLIALLEDRDVALRAIGINGRAFPRIRATLQQDETFVLQAASLNGNILEFVSEDMKKDINICSAAVGSKGRALRFVDADLKDNIELCLKAVKTDSTALDFVPRCIREHTVRAQDFIVRAQFLAVQTSTHTLYS